LRVRARTSSGCHDFRNGVCSGVRLQNIRDRGPGVYLWFESSCYDPHLFTHAVVFQTNRAPGRPRPAVAGLHGGGYVHAVRRSGSLRVLSADVGGLDVLRKRDVHRGGWQ
jgi:hypothetical protein